MIGRTGSGGMLAGMPWSDSEGGVGEMAVVECEGWQVVCLLGLANLG